ncbi:MAG: ORF6N domain-containing protein [Patescibacteria group bacterium]
MKEATITEIPLNIELIKEKIYIIRGQKVMFDRDLAILYQVPTKQLNRAVRRNLDRFPNDFMFELTKGEMDNLKCQIGTSSYGGARKPSLAFTEQGIAMLSTVLNSKRAIHVNIEIIRIFTKLRQMIDAYKELREKVEEMEKNSETNFKEIFRVLRAILAEDEKPKSKIGFRPE